MANESRRRRFTVFDIWEKLGVTEHLGGVRATRRLLQTIGVKPGQRVLDIGCGTGFTACLLAKEYGATVVAADINPGILKWAGARIQREGVGDRVTTVLADAQNLPFKSNSFEIVIAESVLIFCDPERAASEINRILKPSGAFGDNELTYLKPPPPWILAVFSEETLGIRTRHLQKDRWKAIYEAAGFVDVSSAVRKIDLWDQFLSHLKVDGIRQYLRSVALSLSDPDIISTFLKRDTLTALVRFGEYIGYGLYVSKKPS